MQCDVLLDSAKVAEERTADHVVGRERKIVFSRVEPLEPAADGNPHVLRRRAAELEAADRGKTAGKIVFENRRVGARDAELGDQAGGVSARAIRSLTNEEILSPFEVAAGKIEFAKRLLVRA